VRGHHPGVVLLALIADTHVRNGTPLLPQRCLDLVARADLVVHAGDIADLGALDQLRAVGPPVFAVRGNVDNRALATVLPEVQQLEVAGQTIGVIHDAGPSRGRLERMRRRFPLAAAVVFGHSHVPLHAGADSGFQIFNPGSPTVRRRQPSHTMGIAHIDENQVSFQHIILD
jgi:putative phosphoesterase